MPKFLHALTSVALLVPLMALSSAPAEAQNASITLKHKLEFTYWGFDRTATHETFSTAAVGDITGDGQPDIVAGAPDGVLKAWHANGTRFLDHWVGNGAIHASPALVDLDRDGVLDVLTASLSGDIVGVRGDGRRVFHARDRGDMPKRGIFGTPTAADIDNDGQLEVVATSWDHHVHVWNLDGSYVPGFPLFVFDTIWSSPSVADIDKDGWLEIVFGGDMDAYPGAPAPPGGLVWAIRHNGKRQPNWPPSVHGQVVWSTPAIADLDGDGKLDVTVGTGLNWPDPNGRSLQSYHHDGSNVGGWPVTTGGRVMGSPAVGDLTGDGRADVASLADDGRVTVYNHLGQVQWSRCAISFTDKCRAAYGVHGQVSIGDVDNDGVQEVVAAAEHWLRIYDGRTGAEEASYPMPGVWAPAAAPTIAQVGGETWIVLNTTVDAHADGLPGVGDKQTVWIWSTGTKLGKADWPTFKHNSRRTGSLLDTVPPVASLNGFNAAEASPQFSVGWTGTDVGSGVKKYDVQFRRDGGGWTWWIDGTSRTSGTFYGMQGERYDFRVRAHDRAGNVGVWSPIESTAVSPAAVSGMPFKSLYSISASGDVGELSSPPLQDRKWSPHLGRGIAMAPDGKGGYLLDGWGGLHPVGNAPGTTGSGYWPGWDIARGIALNADGRSGYKVDAFGGIHAFGGAKAIKGSAYWGGQDLTRDIVLLATSTALSPAGYVLDAYGGLHPFGSAPAFADGGRRWRGWNIARGFALNPAGTGGWILDGWGGLHPVGGAPRVASAGYWYGWDIARDVVAVSASAGYVLDGFGAVRGFGGAPAPQHGAYWGIDVARSLSVAR